MKINNRKVRIGIVGCGAIGSRIAQSIKKELNKECQLTALYDIDQKKSIHLAKSLQAQRIAKPSLTKLIEACDCMVEAVNAKSTRNIIRQALVARRHVLAMSVGNLLNAADLFHLAKRNHCRILLPSGAIAGLDAIKAASLVGIDKITLTTRKPTKGFEDSPYFKKKRINLSNIREETEIFRGNVNRAVKYFPQNINVAATLALASQHKGGLTVRILTSPKFKTNSHEIDIQGAFGRIRTQTDNLVCPDNPKTSYLAVLSGIQTLKQFCTGILIGT